MTLVLKLTICDLIYYTARLIREIWLVLATPPQIIRHTSDVRDAEKLSAVVKSGGFVSISSLF